MNMELKNNIILLVTYAYTVATYIKQFISYVATYMCVSLLIPSAQILTTTPTLITLTGPSVTTS